MYFSNSKLAINELYNQCIPIQVRVTYYENCFNLQIITIVSGLSLLTVCDAGVILQTAKDAILKFADVMGDVEKGLEPSILEVVAAVGDLIHNTTDKYSLQNMQEVFSECLQDCFAHLLDEEAMETCISVKKENCELLKNYSDKELMPYYLTLKAGSQVVKLPGKAVGSALGLGDTGDFEYSISKRAVNAGVKLIETTAVEKMTEDFFDTGKQKVLGFIESFGTATNDLGNGIYSGKNSLAEMVDSGKKLSETSEAEQLKNAIEDGKYVVKTALSSSKNIAQSVSLLPIQSVIETGNYAINSFVDSGSNIIKSDEATQFKTAIGDGKNAVSSLVNSRVKLTEHIKSIPQQILTGAISCKTEDVTDPSGSIPTGSVENEQIRKALISGMNAVGTLVGTSFKLVDSLAELPMKTAVDVGNFAVDSILESGLKIAKSDEAMLLNAAVFSGKNTSATIVGSGKKFVETAIDVPLKTASDMKTILLSKP